MKKILVIVHIYYHEMWQELQDCLQNISSSYDLFVTMVKKDEILFKQISNFKAESKIQLIENRGYDVGPFFHVLNQVNLSNYNYLIKLHTKQNWEQPISLNYYNLSGTKWRDYLLSFIKSKENFSLAISAFSENEKLGMLGDFHLIIKKEKYDLAALEAGKKLMAKMNLPPADFGFIAGTMFMARANLFQVLQNLNLTLQDFVTPNRSTATSKAHLFERLLGWVIKAQGFEIADMIHRNPNKIIRFLQVIWFILCRFFYQKKVTKSNKILIKICKIPVFSSKIKKS